jgi:hypothetical protein
VFGFVLVAQTVSELNHPHRWMLKYIESGNPMYRYPSGPPSTYTLATATITRRRDKVPFVRLPGAVIVYLDLVMRNSLSIAGNRKYFDCSAVNRLQRILQTFAKANRITNRR